MVVPFWLTMWPFLVWFGFVAWWWARVFGLTKIRVKRSGFIPFRDSDV